MKIGIIGAGYVGRGIAALAVKHGHRAMLSNSRGPQSLRSDHAMLGCEVGTIDEAARFGDIVALTTTVQHFRSLPVELLTGKVVIDVVNYYPSRDTHFPELDNKHITSSELLARHLPESKIVKAFNAILMVPDFEQHGRPPGHFNRRALPLAGDDAEAKRIVADLHDQFGYDPLDVGPLAEGWRFEPGTPVYCVSFNKVWIQRALAEARRGTSA